MSFTSPTDATQASGGIGSEKPAAGQSPEQLRALAAQFESMLMSQMMRGMRTSVFDDSKDTGFGDGPLSDALYNELSLALSRAGGFGLGQSILGPLARQAQQKQGGTLTPSSPATLTALADLPAPSTTAAAPASTMVAVTSARPEAAPLAAAPAQTPARSSTPPASRATDARISSAYGWRKDPIDGTSKFHKGLDIAMPVGTPVAAARDGEVGFAGEVPGYGLTVVVNHAGRIATRYAHLSEIDVKPGQVVSEGQVIARSGATGRVTGPHLHFEVLDDGQPTDPDALVGQALRHE